MSKPEIAEKAAAFVDVEAGKTYYWCACGRSKAQPFCDGSHAGTEFTPLAWTPEKTKRYALCQCKHTKRPPFCDGSHNQL
jgi:CDGSH iron-sulfur domain-containing protein 3